MKFEYDALYWREQIRQGNDVPNGHLEAESIAPEVYFRFQADMRKRRQKLEEFNDSERDLDRW